MENFAHQVTTASVDLDGAVGFWWSDWCLCWTRPDVLFTASDWAIDVDGIGTRNDILVKKMSQNQKLQNLNFRKISSSFENTESSKF